MTELTVCRIPRRSSSNRPQADFAPPSRILVLGLGNEILKDDAAGIRVAEALGRCFPSGVEIRSTSIFGLSLLDELVGKEKVLLIDSYVPVNPAHADIREVAFDSLDNSNAACPHFAGLAEIREAMCSIEADFPREVRILAVPVLDPFTFSTEMSPEVAARLETAVARAAKILQTWLPSPNTPFRS